MVVEQDELPQQLTLQVVVVILLVLLSMSTSQLQSPTMELSPQEAAYIEMKLQLARTLRDRRKRRRMTQVALAKLLRSSQSRIAKMEAGDPSVSLDLLVRSLLALGASKRDLGRVLSSDKSRRAT